MQYETRQLKLERLLRELKAYEDLITDKPKEAEERKNEIRLAIIAKLREILDVSAFGGDENGNLPGEWGYHE